MNWSMNKMKRRAARIALSVAMLAAARSSQAVVNDGAPGKSAPPEMVIIELTAPPAALAGQAGASAASATAAAQRARMRQKIIGLENQKRAASGLAAASSAAVVRREYGVVLNGFAARVLPDTVAALQADPEVRRRLRSVSLAEAREVFRRTNVDVLALSTAESYDRPLAGFFKAREKRR